MRQFELARQVEAERVRVAAALRQARSLREQAAALSGKAPDAAAAALSDFERAMVPMAGPAVSPEEFFNLSDAAPTSLLRLNATLARFQGAVESADAAPSPDAAVGFTERKDSVEQSLAGWQAFLESELPKANRALEAASLPALRTGEAPGAP